jgi:hypothetical protein
MEKIIKISDISGKECTNPILISIEREGWVMKIGNTNHVHRAVFDADLNELADIAKSIEFTSVDKSDITAAMPNALIRGAVAPPQQAQMYSYRPVSRRRTASIQQQTKPPDSPDYMEPE